MARRRNNTLPSYLEFSPLTECYYYRNPSMRSKANLGKERSEAVQTAQALNAQYRIKAEQSATKLYASLDLGAPRFADAMTEFVDKYIKDHHLKASTAKLLQQRRNRLIKELGEFQVPVIDTQMLSEVLERSSQFEQTKLKTLLGRFFNYAASKGMHPAHLANPVDKLYIDPIPPKKRQRISIRQFRAIYVESPEWLKVLLTLAFHLALRRVDLVNLRFDDVVGDRIVSRIRKTDTEARDIEATSVDFPIHPDVRKAIASARVSSLKNGRCPFIVHRAPDRKTKRAKDALDNGRIEHPCQVLPQYASKAFEKARDTAMAATEEFCGLGPRELPTLHEVRSLSSFLYSKAGYDVAKVQDLMAHTDPDMTRAYQKGHARKVLKVDFMLPFSVSDGDEIKEPAAHYRVVEIAA